MTTSFAKFHLVAKRPVLQYQREYYAHLRTCSPAAGPYSQSTEISVKTQAREAAGVFNDDRRPAGRRTCTLLCHLCAVQSLTQLTLGIEFGR
jgi:hypothetical protein